MSLFFISGREAQQTLTDAATAPPAPPDEPSFFDDPQGQRHGWNPITGNVDIGNAILEGLPQDIGRNLAIQKEGFNTALANIGNYFRTPSSNAAFSLIPDQTGYGQMSARFAHSDAAPQQWIDDAVGRAQDAHQEATRLQIDPRTRSQAAALVGETAGFLAGAGASTIAGGPAGPALALTNTAVGTQEEANYRNISEGMAPEQARQAAMIEGGFAGLMTVLPPAFRGRLLTRLASGAGIGVGLGMAERGSLNSYLHAVGYPELAERYKWVDPQEMAIGAIMGAAFGGIMGHPNEPHVPLELTRAALVHQDTINRDLAFGVPVDDASARWGSETLSRMEEQAANDQPIDPGEIPDGVDFVPRENFQGLTPDQHLNEARQLGNDAEYGDALAHAYLAQLGGAEGAADTVRMLRQDASPEEQANIMARVAEIRREADPMHAAFAEEILNDPHLSPAEKAARLAELQNQADQRMAERGLPPEMLASVNHEQGDLFPGSEPGPLRVFHGTFEKFAPDEIAPMSHFGTKGAARERIRQTRGRPSLFGKRSRLLPFEIVGRRVSIGAEPEGLWSSATQVADALLAHGHISREEHAWAVEPRAEDRLRFEGRSADVVVQERIAELAALHDIGAIGYTNAIEDKGSLSYIVPNPRDNVRSAKYSRNPRGPDIRRSVAVEHLASLPSGSDFLLTGDMHWLGKTEPRTDAKGNPVGVPGLTFRMARVFDTTKEAEAYAGANANDIMAVTTSPDGRTMAVMKNITDYEDEGPTSTRTDENGNTITEPAATLTGPDGKTVTGTPEELAVQFDKLISDRTSRTLNSVTNNRGGASGVEALKAAAQDFLGADWNALADAGHVEILPNTEALRDLLRSEGKPEGANRLSGFEAAVHFPGAKKTYFIADGLRPERMKALILHEIGVHHGMESMLGKRGMNALLRQIDLMAADHHPEVMKARKRAIEDANFKEDVPEETLAYLIENNADLPLVTRYLSNVRQWLIKTFGTTFGMRLTVDDVRALAVSSLRRVATQARREAFADEPMVLDAFPAFSKQGPDGSRPASENAPQGHNVGRYVGQPRRQGDPVAARERFPSPFINALRDNPSLGDGYVLRETTDVGPPLFDQNAPSFDIVHSGQKVGDVWIGEGDGQVGLSPRVEPAFRRQGVATRLYNTIDRMAQDHGLKLTASDNLTDDGAAFWAARNAETSPNAGPTSARPDFDTMRRASDTNMPADIAVDQFMPVAPESRTTSINKWAGDIESAARRLLRDGRGAQEDVPLASLTATQPGVDTGGLRAAYNGKARPAEQVLVYDTPQGRFLVDGHHRAIAAMLRGEKNIRADVVRDGHSTSRDEDFPLFSVNRRDEENLIRNGRDPIESPDYQERLAALRGEDSKTARGPSEVGSVRANLETSEGRSGRGAENVSETQGQTRAELGAVTGVSGIRIATKKVGARASYFGKYRAEIDTPEGAPAASEAALRGGVDFDLIDGNDPKETRLPGVYIRLTGVDEAARGKGVGLWLYRQMVDWADRQRLPVYSDFSISKDAQAIYPALERRGYSVEQIAPYARDPEDGGIVNVDFKPIYRISRTGVEDHYEAAPPPREDYQIDGPTLRDRIQAVEDARARDEAYQAMSPAEQAIADDPNMKFSVNRSDDGKPERISARDLLARTEEEKAQAAEMRKGFEAAAKCAARNASTQVFRSLPTAASFVSLRATAAGALPSADAMIGQVLGLGASIPLGVTGAPLILNASRRASSTDSYLNRLNPDPDAVAASLGSNDARFPVVNNPSETRSAEPTASELRATAQSYGAPAPEANAYAQSAIPSGANNAPPPIERGPPDEQTGILPGANVDTHVAPPSAPSSDQPDNGAEGARLMREFLESGGRKQ